MNKLAISFLVLLIAWLAVVSQSAERSSAWDTVREAHLILEPACQWCGKDDIKKLEVHHIRPFHKEPDLELDQANLITLCRFCHFVVGHNCNWSKDNENVRKDCEHHNEVRH